MEATKTPSTSLVFPGLVTLDDITKKRILDTVNSYKDKLVPYKVIARRLNHLDIPFPSRMERKGGPPKGKWDAKRLSAFLSSQGIQRTSADRGKLAGATRAKNIQNKREKQARSTIEHYTKDAPNFKPQKQSVGKSESPISGISNHLLEELVLKTSGPIKALGFESLRFRMGMAESRLKAAKASYRL